MQQSFGLVSQNPVLRNITDYLIEEASAEEEELLGQASETEESEEKDSAMIKVNQFKHLLNVKPFTMPEYS